MANVYQERYKLIIRREKWPDIEVDYLTLDGARQIRSLLYGVYRNHTAWKDLPNAQFTVNETQYSIYVGCGFDVEIKRVSSY